jgi:hypothetical protein
MNLEGSDRSLFHGTIPVFSWRGWGKKRKTLVRIASVPAEIRTERFPNPSLERYRYTSVVRSYFLFVSCILVAFLHFRQAGSDTRLLYLLLECPQHPTAGESCTRMRTDGGPVSVASCWECSQRGSVSLYHTCPKYVQWQHHMSASFRAAGSALLTHLTRMEPGGLSRYCDWLRARLSRFDSRQGQEVSLYSTASGPALGSTQLHIQWVPGTLHAGVKWPGPQADHSSPSSAKVKNDGAITPLSRTSSRLGA